MKSNFINKCQLILIGILGILLAGMIILGILGTNNTKNYDSVDQLKVSVSLDLTESSKKAQEITEKYLQDNSIDTYSFGSQTLNDGRVFVYQIKSGDVNVDELKSAIDSVINNSKVSVKVDVSEVTVYSENQGLRIAGVLAITTVAIFVVLIFVEKWKSALTVAITSSLSALLFFALINIVRLPAVSLLVISLSVAFLIGAVLSSVIIVRFREIIKNSSNTIKSIGDVAKQGIVSSLLRVCFICVVLSVLGILLATLLGGYLLFVGLQIVIASIAACVCAIFVTPLIWVSLNEKKSLN